MESRDGSTALTMAPNAAQNASPQPDPHGTAMHAEKDTAKPTGEPFCGACRHWTPTRTGLRPHRRGVCGVHHRATDAISGETCREFQARALAAIDDEIRKRRPAVPAVPSAADERPF